MTATTLRILNLGWGVQSFSIAAMSALGELPKLDAAVHADTTHERSATYAFAAKWTPWLEEHGVCVVTVSDPEQAAFVSTAKTDIPAFTNARDGSAHKAGMLNRQCTGRWKITPIRRWLREQGATQAEQWLGISWDEIQRMRDSDVQWITLHYPLIEKRMTRQDCINWLERAGLDVPPRSSCVFCPYQSRRSWYDLKDKGGSDWQKAVEVDSAIRGVRPPHDLYLHPDRVPLESITTPKENGQLALFASDDECAGVCFI